MKAQIISVGTELLLGDIINTNAAYLSQQFASLGINVFQQLVVGDNESRLFKIINKAYQETEVIIATGGLGPTKDDITKEVFAKYFKLDLVYHKDIEQDLIHYFASNQKNFTKNNLKQAYIPENAIILENNNGTASGIIIEKDKKIAVLLPGPPDEMVPMFQESVIPYFKNKTNQTFYSTTIKICGVGEAKAEEMVADLIAAQSNPTIAPYAKLSEVHFRITAASKSIEEAKRMIKPLKEKFYQRFGNYIFGEDDDTLDSVAIDLLKHKLLTLSIVESCSGGLLTSALVSHPGISSYLKESIIAYSNQAKIDHHLVSRETLQKYGAVSKETVLELAKNIAITSKSDIGLAITGIAGPSGGSKEKPIGLVYIGLYYKDKLEYIELFLKGNRQKIRERTVKMALNQLRLFLQDND